MFTMCDYIMLKIKGLACSRCKSVLVLQKQALFVEAVDKLDSHFDLVKLIKTIRRTELLANVLLSKHHEYFLPVLKQSILTGKHQKEPDNE